MNSIETAQSIISNLGGFDFDLNIGKKNALVTAKFDTESETWISTFKRYPDGKIRNEQCKILRGVIFDKDGKVSVRGFPGITRTVLSDLSISSEERYSPLIGGVTIMVSWSPLGVRFTTNGSHDAKNSRFGTKKTFYDYLLEIMGEQGIQELLEKFFPDESHHTKVHYITVCHPDIILGSRIDTEGFVYYIGECEIDEYVSNSHLTRHVKTVSKIWNIETLDEFPPLTGIVPFFWLSREGAERVFEQGEGLLKHSQDGTVERIEPSIMDFRTLILGKVNNLGKEFAEMIGRTLDEEFLEKLTGTRVNSYENRCTALINSLPRARREKAVAEFIDFTQKKNQVLELIKKKVGFGCSKLSKVTSEQIYKKITVGYPDAVPGIVLSKYEKQNSCLETIQKIHKGAQNACLKKRGSCDPKVVWNLFCVFLDKLYGLALYQLVKNFDATAWE